MFALRANYDILTPVLYALRKLIAFVFLGGMFWFIYQDLDNLDKPWFMHALGLITIAFAFFWLLIPMIVVKLRIRRRIRQNRVRYEKWLADGGVASIHPRPAQKARLNPVDPGELAFSHEKGTLYILSGLSGNVRYSGLWINHALDKVIAPQPETDNYLTLEGDEKFLTVKCFLPNGEQLDEVTLKK